MDVCDIEGVESGMIMVIVILARSLAGSWWQRESGRGPLPIVLDQLFLPSSSSHTSSTRARETHPKVPAEMSSLDVVLSAACGAVSKS
ncbi:hypothetical protein MRB53_037639 [Persea americana]|nr:hypothetical protein MRB53_037639 [Persea americana]